MRVRWIIRSAATALVGGLALVTTLVGQDLLSGPPTGRSAVATVLSVDHADAAALDGGGDQLPPWAPPAWFPHTPLLEAVAQLDAPGPRKGPSVRSRSVVVFDVDRGEVLFEKNADTVRPVASITKVVSALTLMSVGGSLERELCVDARMYPSRSGARSRLSTGDCTTGWDLLGAALVASDNRAAYGLAAVAGLDLDDFVAAMNTVSADLGMTRSSWSDPSGLEDENLSTARDIARATVAVAAHPVLSSVASAPFWDLSRSNRSSTRRLFSTDRLVGRSDLLIEAAKTGYTDTARYCFTTALQTRDGRRLVISLLGADGKNTRWADVGRILSWVEAQPA